MGFHGFGQVPVHVADVHAAFFEYGAFGDDARAPSSPARTFPHILLEDGFPVGGLHSGADRVLGVIDEDVETVEQNGYRFLVVSCRMSSSSPHPRTPSHAPPARSA